MEGAFCTLPEHVFTIGRKPHNMLALPDEAVSRDHCLIRNGGGCFVLEDQDSRNGTFVNGIPVRERRLEHGDQIRVGGSLFVFMLQEDPAPCPSSIVELEETRWNGTPTARLKDEDALYLQPAKLIGTLPAASRAVRDLNALLSISTAIHSITGLPALERRILELVFEITPAERGAIFLAGDGQQGFESMFGWDRFSGSEGSVRVSGTVLRQVLRDGEAILSNDLQSGEEFGGAESVISSQARSLLAVALSLPGKTLGVLYLDTRSSTLFDETHLQLVAAIGRIAALALDKARRLASLENENQRLQEEISVQYNMVGSSAPMMEVYRLIKRAAEAEANVLILGESGTGKELVARAIHRGSRRAAKPFVTINCTTLTDALIESELFGHERGAFTGAIAQKRGKVEIADGGTVFLDEIAELAPHLQAKLLRVIQERQFERLGGTRPIDVNIRILAATNRDLAVEIREGKFRHDLFFRLNVVSLTMPPLRERRDDIPLLANYFISRYSAETKRRVSGLSPRARTVLCENEWPGNVRELQNAIERAVVMGSSHLIEVEDLPEEMLEVAAPEKADVPGYHEAVRETKKELILRAIEQASGNLTEAARLLGLHANYLHRLIRNLNLRPEIKR